MKRLSTLVLSAAMAVCAAPPALAQDTSEPSQERIAEEAFPDEMEAAKEAFAKAMSEEFAIFGEFFKAEPLTEEQEAALPLAESMVDKIFPAGTFAIVMEESMQPMFDVIMMAAAPGDRVELSQLTGIEMDELDALDDAAAEEALAIFDPDNAERTEAMGEMVVGLIGDMLQAIEPAYRSGLSRAYATRFSRAEMEELLAFFDTPLGGKFAVQTTLVQYDPQVMGVMEDIGPAMSEVLPKMIVQIAELAEKYPDARKFGELSAAERDRAARLLGKSEQELEALQPVEEEAADFDEDEPVA